MWNIKNDIFKAISNSVWIGFNIDSNYLNQNEVKIFLNSILKSIWESSIDINKSIWEFKNIFSQKNNLQIIWNWFKNDLIARGNSKISEAFFKKFISWRPFFAITEFSNSLK